MSYIKSEQGFIRIGALKTVAELVENPLIKSKYPAFIQVAEKFGAPNITNLATIGGNICAAASSEDYLPLFMALDAKVRVRSRRGERISRVEDFVLSKRTVDLEPGEIVTEVFFEELNADSHCAYDKIGRRKSLIIALVNIAVFLQLDRQSRTIRNIRVALNRLKGKIPQRAILTELRMFGRTLDDATIEGGVKTLTSELRAKSDYRASGEYRFEVAKTLFRRIVAECRETILRR